MCGGLRGRGLALRQRCLRMKAPTTAVKARLRAPGMTKGLTMLANLKSLLDEARSAGHAVACINAPSVDLARAIVAAAEQVGCPVVLAHAEVHDAVVPVEVIGPHLMDLARRASVPVAVHADHGYSREFVTRCVSQGFTSVMNDLSTEPFQDNLDRLSDLTAVLHAADISVEAELGVMGSSAHDPHGGPAADRRAGFTDPDAAAMFAKASGVDALAVCFGTVHGLY